MQVSVDVIDLDFAPRELTVNKGATVTWTFSGDLPHNVTDDRGAFASKTVQKGAEYTRTFDQPGIFYYFCTIHHGMLGTLTVKEVEGLLGGWGGGGARRAATSAP